MANSASESVGSGVFVVPQMQATIPQPDHSIHWKEVGVSAGVDLLVTFLGGLAVALIAKRWAEKKIEQVLTQRVEGSGNQGAAVQGNITELNQSIRNLADNIRIMGDQNLTASVQGDGDINQNYTEVRTDFKQDTPHSAIVVGQIAKGLQIFNALNMNLSSTETEAFGNAINAWFKETAAVLNNVSQKASVYFQNVDTTSLGVSYFPNQRAGELRAILRKCLNCLNEILRAS